MTLKWWHLPILLGVLFLAVYGGAVLFGDCDDNATSEQMWSPPTPEPVPTAIACAAPTAAELANWQADLEKREAVLVREQAEVAELIEHLKGREEAIRRAGG